jgi:predicted nucleic acid-binding protein
MKKISHEMNPDIFATEDSDLIGLSKIDYLHLLMDMFKVIYIPEAVYKKTVIQGEDKLGVNEIKSAEWIKPNPIEDKLAVELLEVNLSRGEAETIVLAKEMKADLVILDEKEARKIAIISNLNVVGTLGILRQARSEGRIDDIIAVVDRLGKQFGFKDEREFIKDAVNEKIWILFCVFCYAINYCILKV